MKLSSLLALCVVVALSPDVQARSPRHTSIALAAQGGLYSLAAWMPTSYGAASGSSHTADMSLGVDLTWGVGRTRRTRLGLRATAFFVPGFPDQEPADAHDTASGPSIAGAGLGFLLARSWFRVSPGFRVNHVWIAGPDGSGRMTAPEFNVSVGLDVPVYGPLALRIAGEAGLWLPPATALIGRLSLGGGVVLQL